MLMYTNNSFKNTFNIYGIYIEIVSTHLCNKI